MLHSSPSAHPAVIGNAHSSIGCCKPHPYKVQPSALYNAQVPAHTVHLGCQNAKAYVAPHSNAKSATRYSRGITSLIPLTQILQTYSPGLELYAEFLLGGHRADCEGAAHRV